MTVWTPVLDVIEEEMMEYVGLALLLVGAVLLVVGYRRNSRNILLGAALLLLASHALPEFVAGVQGGFAEASARTMAPR